MRRTLAAALVCVFAPACGRAVPRTAELTVFAASSLTEAFEAIGASFERAYAGVDVRFNFGASSTLVAQLQQGASADVVASADERSMRKLGRRVEAPKIFARNALEIVVATGNPEAIGSLRDLVRPGLRIALAAPAVPAGRYAAAAFAKAGVAPPAASEEPDVKAVVAKVSLGEADAGVVYVTDVRAARGKVDGVVIASEQNVGVRYPIAVVKDAPHAEAASAFVRYVLRDGGDTLRSFGFSV